MRVLHLRSSIGYGGAESFLKHLLPALGKLGVTCGLIVSHRPGQISPQLNVAVEYFWDIVDRGRFDFNIFSKIDQIVKIFQPDVLHSHSYKSNLAALLMKRKHKLPVVTTLHGYTGATKLVQIYEMFDRTMVIPQFDAIINLVPGGKGHYTILNGVDPEEIYHRSQPPAERNSLNEFYLITIGRASPEKGYDVLIMALSELGSLVPWRWILVGDGPWLPWLRKRVEQAGMMDKVLFTGFIENPLPLLAAADALVIPSYREQCPLVVLEAMALGKVVIASAVGALPYLVDHEKTGWLVRPGDPIALREAVLTAWNRRWEWAKMGCLAQERVKSTFNISTTAKQYLEVYRRVLSRKTE